MAGEIDIDNAEHLAAHLLRAYRHRGAPLVLALSAVTFMDVAAVDALVHVDARIIAEGTRPGLRVRCASRSAVRAMSVGGGFGDY